ncbi:MAG: F0F1 ATP synthase subunit A [Clostridiales bacterium]|jgi:F-type H+-transporting ATPase subunit a|nr:F0F1 ATP synthase subunit A [Clostridiales bacterium]
MSLERFIPYSSGGELPEITPKVLTLWGFEITETMLSGAVTVAVLVILALVIRLFCIPRWRKHLSSTTGVQTVLEKLVEGIESNCDEMIFVHSKNQFRFLTFWFFAVVLYIFFGTFIEVLALRPLTASLSMTLTVALFTFVFIHILGFVQASSHKQLKNRFKHYLNPINIITDSVVPMSMALRMFISVFSGYLIMSLLYSIPFPVAHPVIGYLIFTLFHAVVQSYVFFVLSTGFISEAIE